MLGFQVCTTIPYKIHLFSAIIFWYKIELIIFSHICVCFVCTQACMYVVCVCTRTCVWCMWACMLTCMWEPVSMHVCYVCLHVCGYMQACMFICVGTCRYAFLHVRGCMWVCMFDMYLYICVYMKVCMFICVGECKCAFLHVCGCMWVCMFKPEVGVRSLLQSSLLYPLRQSFSSEPKSLSVQLSICFSTSGIWNYWQAATLTLAFR